MNFLKGLIHKNSTRNNRRIGLALGGGAVLGAAHIGVLRALQELEIEINAVAGTSIGALVGALFAFGKGWEEIQNIALNLKWLDAAAPMLSQYGLLTNRKLGETLKDVIGDVEFSQAKIPLAMIAVDIASGEKVILDHGNVAKAMMASTCIPGVFTPIDLDGKMLVDGGLMEIVPITPLKEMGVDRIIAVDLLTTRHTKRKPQNLVDIMLNSYHIALRNACNQYIAQAEIVIAPDLAGFNTIDTHQVPDLIQLGYEAALNALQQIEPSPME